MKKTRIPSEDPDAVRARDNARLDDPVQPHTKGVFSFVSDDTPDGATPPRRARGVRDGLDIDPEDAS